MWNKNEMCQINRIFAQSMAKVKETEMWIRYGIFQE